MKAKHKTSFMKWWVQVFAFVLLAALLIAPTSALARGYSVAPGYGSAGTPAPDLAPITFWDLSPREMVIVGALAVSPALVFPIELLLMIKLFSCLAFRRVARANILSNLTRNTVYSCIAKTPGIGPADLARETGISRGTLNYHLALLKFSGKIAVAKMHGSLGYFENNAKYDDFFQIVLKHLRNESEKTILEVLAARPGSTRSDLERVLGVSGPTVTWHMQRMSADNLLAIRKEGRHTRYFLTGRTLECLNEYADRRTVSAPAHTHDGTFFPSLETPVDSCT